MRTIKDLIEWNTGEPFVARIDELKILAREYIKEIEDEHNNRLKRYEKMKKEYYDNPDNFDEIGAMKEPPIHALLTDGENISFRTFEQPKIDLLKKIFDLEESE